MYDIPESALLFADSNRGVYIPQHFAEAIKRDLVEGVTDEEWRILEAGPDCEGYWDVWNGVEMNAVICDADGQRFTLYQDGDLWLIPQDA